MAVNPNTERQEEDFYATNPTALLLFLEQLEEDRIYLDKKIWECACGEGHLSKVLQQKQFNVKSSDLINRGFGEVQDFLSYDGYWSGDILTNPPFKLAEEFIEKSMQIQENGAKLLLLLKIQFLEGHERYKLFKKYPPKYVYCYSSRQLCSRNGDFENFKATTLFYAWYVFERGYIGETILRWIKPKLTKINDGNDGIPPKPKDLGILPTII